MTTGDFRVLYAAALDAATARVRDALAASATAAEPAAPAAPADPDACARGTHTSLARQLDAAVLPVVCHELAVAREAGTLRGATPQVRYRDFWARGILDPAVIHRRYPVLAAEIEAVASTTADAVVRAVRRLADDRARLARELPGTQSPLTAVTPVGSDRHAGGGQVIAFDFGAGSTRVYYKPVPLRATTLLHRFLELAGVPPELHPGRLRIVDRGGYGWMEEARFAPCHDTDQVRRFWRRCGVLLAACCLLNFTDGHFENLVAAGEHPVLVDTETLFQNYAWRNPGGRLESVVDTGLVQRADPATPGRGAFSAFQVVGGGRLTAFAPAATGPGTDAMAVRFRRTVHERPVNLPVMDGRFQTVDTGIDDLIDGFRTVFGLCRARRRAILADSAYWDEVAAYDSRQIIRETAYYARLLRLMEQPDHAADRARVRQALTRWLRFEDPGSRYNALVPDEIAALDGFDVPYFTHRVDGTALSSRARTHPGFFRSSALDQIRRTIRDRGEEFVEAQVAFLRANLSTPPADTALGPQDARLLGGLLAARHPAPTRSE